MCGIAGIFQPKQNRSRRPNGKLIEAMTNAIAHRGPDGSGIFLDNHVGLGHRRLSIIDVATGQQPLFNEDNSVCVVYNGEIYNYQELVKELEALGHHFKTRSDTEVIVHAWEQWREESVKRFRGMFAYALWDSNTKTFFMARDRMGVKPAYYGITTDGDLVFGSELKALLRHPHLSRSLRADATDDYFAYGYVPDPKTIFESCSKLAPAHHLSWQVGQAKPTIKRYWDIDFNSQAKGTEAELAEEMRARVSESVKLRMISEVPIGAFLSGGVDSSAVVVAMSQLSTTPVKTCSIGFDAKQFDETEYAQYVAKRYATDHFARTVTVDDFGLLDQIAHMYDEPFADSSAIPTFRVCQLARERVTVALSGDGGDETFGGYRRYKMHLIEERTRQMLPTAIRKIIFGALGATYPKADWAPKILRAKTTFQALAMSAVEAYQTSVGCVRAPQRCRIYSEDFKRKLGVYDPIDQMRDYAKTGPQEPLAMIQNLDYLMYLPGDINVKVDRASMASSLETREPLMDHKLMEWAATLPPSLKINQGETKYLFKKTYEPYLSSELLYRPKMGFSVPLAQWFKNELNQYLMQRASQPDFSQGILNATEVKQMLREHATGARDWATPLWTILMYDAFLKNLSAIPIFAQTAPEAVFEAV